MSLSLWAELACSSPGGVKHTVNFIRQSLWRLSKSHISLAEHSGRRRKEVFCYWRSLAGLSTTTVSCFGLASDHSYKGRKIAGAAGPVPSRQAAQHTKATIYIALGGGKGWHGPSGILISRRIDQMSPPAVLHYQNSMYRKLLEKGRPQNNTESMKCPPFLHMESSSLRCQDKTWEQQLSLETSKSDSLFHGTEREDTAIKLYKVKSKSWMSWTLKKLSFFCFVFFFLSLPLPFLREHNTM